MYVANNKVSIVVTVITFTTGLIIRSGLQDLTDQFNEANTDTEWPQGETLIQKFGQKLRVSFKSGKFVDRDEMSLM